MAQITFEHELEKLNTGDKGENKPLLLRAEFDKRKSERRKAWGKAFCK